MDAPPVRRVNIDEEMQQAYLDYAMSVIVSRALPDARDGLKPVHRRILYAMHDMGLRPDSGYKKSARVVGEVLGKYHPHSDVAVYDAMARMAQTFSMRVSLVDGQGNFGSVDGDPPAAMRYTEARLAPPAADILADIDKNTVNFSDNFDASLREPDVLPAAFPNLLVNGATGIAVGMSTNVPPHNLVEVVDAIIYMLENWSKLDEISVDDLMRFIQGPDFPTGGVILQSKMEEGLSLAYGSGRGKVIVQALAHVEGMGRGRERILVTELPYQVNKASLIEKIASQVREGQLEGISDLRDESDRQGMRIVIELSKTADANKVLQSLYKRTPMQSTFGIILLALVKGEPRLLGLKQALRVYIEHRLEVVRRRSEFEMEKARQRAHVVEGLRVALNNLDAVIDLIRKAADAEEARSKLVNRFDLSDIQANAILDMPLRRLAALERKKIEIEYKELQSKIKSLAQLLASPKKMRTLVARELDAIKDAYGDRRRTQIITLEKGAKAGEMLTARELESGKSVWVGITRQGLISRLEEDKAPRPSGKDAPAWLLRASSRDILFLVAESGKAAALPIHALPQTDNLAQGEPLARVSAFKNGEKLAAIFALPPPGERIPAFLLTATANGVVKKSEIKEMPGPGSQYFRLAKVAAGDRIIAALFTTGDSELVLASASGMAIRFHEEEVRSMGLATGGVSGMKLSANDLLVGALALDLQESVFLLASDGRAKRVDASQFPSQGRNGKGVIVWKLEASTQIIGLANQKGTTRATIHLKKLAAKSLRLDDAPLVSRQANGKTLIDIRKDDEISCWAVPILGLETAAKLGKSRPVKDKVAKKKPAPSAKSKTRAKKSK